MSDNSFMSDVSEQGAGDLLTKRTKALNVLHKHKHNPKINAEDIFTDGENIISQLSDIYYDSRIPTANRRNYNPSRVMSTSSNAVKISLDGTFSKVDHVPGLKTTLYRHQQTVVKAMLDLEYKRSFQQRKVGCPNNSSTYKIVYNAAVLSEPVGSGKTIDILAVICLSCIPRAIPDIMELHTKTNVGSAGYVRCKFKKFLKPTIIFVGSSVMRQWAQAIKQFTNLKTFCINSVVELKKLFDMISNKTVNEYNIILVKNGKITVPIKLPNGIELEDKNNGATPFIYNLIANLRSYCWSRVVVDDFDTIKLPRNAGIVRGIFTWYISSTRKKMEHRVSHTINYHTASDWMRNHDYGCAQIMYNNFLFHNLNVRNGLNYLKATTDMPCPKYHVALFKNPNDRYISLLTSMNDSEINRITEMLNGDAIGSAAEAAGIKTTSVADIFSRLLGDKYKSYRFAGDLLEFIEFQEDKKSDREPISENPDDEDTYKKTDLMDFRDIKYMYPGINSLLRNTSDEYTNIKEINGLAIERVKANIAHGECPVCHRDLSESCDIIIVKCCNVVFCGTCGITAQNLNNTGYRLQNGRCSNCRSKLTIKDLLYIGDEIDIDDIADENLEEESDEEVIGLKVVEINALKKSRKNTTKYSAIINIIRGENIAEDIRVDLHIPNMMKGTNYLPEAQVRKILIFANFEETLTNVVKELDDEGINYWRLAGGVNEIADTSFKFTSCTTTCALVINSGRYCAGLNLQTATDLIFAHRMIDQSVESQVAGRGHRLGRTSPLNIWYMLYDNEYSELRVTHSVRELSASELVHEKTREAGTEHAAVTTVTDNAQSGLTTRC
jgi:hypothetical protein